MLFSWSLNLWYQMSHSALSGGDVVLVGSGALLATGGAVDSEEGIRLLSRRFVRKLLASTAWQDRCESSPLWFEKDLLQIGHITELGCESIDGVTEVVGEESDDVDGVGRFRRILLRLGCLRAM